MKIIRGKNYKIEWRGNHFVAEMNKLFSKEVEEKAAKNIASLAKSLCPVGSINRRISAKGASKGKTWSSRTPGRLRESIKPYKSKYKDGGWIVHAGGFDPFYAWMVEYGVPGISPKPYLRPALHIERYRLDHYLSNVRRRSRYLKAA